jgi:hypothetical protein
MSRTTNGSKHQRRTDAGDHAISEAEVGGTSPGAIENQQLVLDEHRFGDHGTGAAGTGEPGDCRQEMQKQHGQIAHRTMLPSSRHGRRMLRNLKFATHTPYDRKFQGRRAV